jgi:hypothetical protein
MRADRSFAPESSTGSGGTSAFRYRLVDLSGYELATVERERPLQADDPVDVRFSPEGETTNWRVVSVLGRSAVVVRAQEAERRRAQRGEKAR